jgi:hypothetical protein
MKCLILLLLLSTSVFAELPKVIVKNLYLEAEKARGTNRSYNIPDGHTPSNYANLGLDLTFTKYVYNNSKIKSVVDQSQFRNVSLDTELGIKLYSVDIYIRHFSGHALDSEYGKKFPQENSVGVRFNLIGDKK